jgi:hypothetical protein
MGVMAESDDERDARVWLALAKVPVWTLLLADADWRWIDHRDDSPWYPTMRLFRQERDGDWGGVLERVCDALPSYLTTPPGFGTI